MTRPHTVHVRLDLAHGRVHGALSILVAAALDDAGAHDRLTKAHSRVDGAASRLAAMALEDLHGAAMPSGGGVHVSTSLGTSTTEAAAERTAVDYDRICGKLERAAADLEHKAAGRPSADSVCSELEHVADQLEDLLEQLTPKATTAPCVTPGCQANGTHAGRCWPCNRYVRKFHADPPPKLVADWNRALKKECGCGTDCCPDGCIRMVEPGKGSIHPTCRKRRSRARRAAAEPTGSTDGVHSWRWHNPT